jgi:hypothetical protein
MKRKDQAALCHAYPITDMLSGLDHIPYGSVLGLWVKAPSRTKTGKTLLREHRLFLDLTQALELRHKLEIAIEIQKEKAKRG